MMWLAGVGVVAVLTTAVTLHLFPEEAIESVQEPRTYLFETTDGEKHNPFTDPPTAEDDATPEENQWRYTLDHLD